MKTEVFKSKEFLESSKKLPVIVGKDKDGKLIIEDLRDINNLLVVGQIGTPRVPFIQELICGLYLKCSPENIKMLLIDFIGVELGPYSHIPHTKFSFANIQSNGSVIKSYDKCLDSLNNLVKESHYRYQKIKEQGVENIEKYNKIAKEKMPYIVCVVENPHRVKKNDIPIIQDYIAKITKHSKETGICFVYTLNNVVNTDEEHVLISRGETSELDNWVVHADEEYEVLTENMINCFSSKIIFWLEDNNRFFKELKIKDDEKFRKCWFSKLDSFLQKIEVSLISEEECNKIARRG